VHTAPSSREIERRDFRAGPGPKDETNIQLKAAEHYNSRQDKRRKLDSKLDTLQQKNMNNWVKAILISTSVKPGCSILDLACGKVIRRICTNMFSC
jgi:hypothetical protein